VTNFIPIFPLQIVVFPGEKLNLHIFEERYIQLVNECHAEEKAFGIPTVINDKVSEMGTLVKIKTIEQQYPDGRMDIKTEGSSIVRILESIQDIPDKLYQGAIVKHQENINDGRGSKMLLILKQLREFHELLNIEKEYTNSEGELTLYDFAHHIGFNIEQEYEFLKLDREAQRQEYILRHFEHVLPTVRELKKLRERIQLNGHFKKLSFDD